ncbi:unnamed protein product [Rotaria magnacalcarata]|uniref:Uncharacterized protein n=4 Tax=Rotaria magnacalcarata TaxID=392030 RepID=A0A816G499_9BILA|nr:unnamed protein product [Rotaria magnacalcarata]CAF2081282.1 unnamed protein product [Rotaria magnacalcarata]CAF3740847.1 unnamed protein product [Rotaria magnacalcarata]
MKTTSLLLEQFKYDKSPIISFQYDPDMPVRVRRILEAVGHERILKIQLGRTPVQEFPLKLLDLLSDSKFTDKQLELGYDELYHNYLLITIENSRGPNVLQHLLEGVGRNTTACTVFKLEKAQRIALKYPMLPDEVIDVYDIPLTPNKTLTLHQLISTASNADENFYKYDAGENNMCQTFVENIIDINGLMANIVDQATLDALKPIDSKALISTLGRRANFVKATTDLSAKLDEIVFDHKILRKKVSQKESGQLHRSNSTDSTSIDALRDAIAHVQQISQSVLHELLPPSVSSLQDTPQQIIEQWVRL